MTKIVNKGSGRGRHNADMYTAKRLDGGDAAAYGVPREAGPKRGWAR